MSAGVATEPGGLGSTGCAQTPLVTSTSKVQGNQFLVPQDQPQQAGWLLTAETVMYKSLQNELTAVS